MWLMEKPTLKTNRAMFQDVVHALEHRDNIPLDCARTRGWVRLEKWGQWRGFEVREGEYALSIICDCGRDEEEVFEFDDFDYDHLVRFLLGETGL